MPTNASEILPGTNLADTIFGLGGDDTIYGLFGDDLLYGGDGNDVIYGHQGDDTLYGDDGDDILMDDIGAGYLFGGAGNDQMTLGSLGYGIDGVADGGAGDDLIMVSQTGTGIVYGGDGNDMLAISWSELSDQAVTADLSLATPFVISSAGNSLQFSGFERYAINSGNFNDSIIGSDQDDRFSVREGDDYVDAGGGDDVVYYAARGAHTLYGGLGEDTLWVSPASSALYFTEDGLTGAVNDGNLSIISGFEHYLAQGSSRADIVSFGKGNDRLYGYLGDDIAFGGGGRDRLVGQGGDDLIYGGKGKDAIFGGRGDDFLSGDAGNDFLFGGQGNDILVGGAGRDRFVFKEMREDIDLILDFTSGEDILRIRADLMASGAPPTGTLASDLLRYGAAEGEHGQFVLVFDNLANGTTLTWDLNGTGDGGEGLVTIWFAGDVTLTAADILLF